MNTSWLIVGLGNPGPRYARNRHNLGFIFLDSLGLTWRKKFQGEFAEYKFQDSKVYALKPETFMNRSGEAVIEALQFYKVAPANLLVVHDEAEIPFGELRVKKGGGNAGHNGLTSIQQSLGTGEFFRLRMGVGRPENKQMDLAAWLLADFPSSEQEQLADFFLVTKEALELLFTEGLRAVQNRFNKRKIS